MRKIVLLFVLTISLGISATSKDTLNAVTMVSYEQGWIDDEGTLALRNNTKKNIYDMTYRITYLDMKGNALDYKDYSSEIDVAHGMTKKVNIPAYEHERYYSYYRSETSPVNPHKFKIKFEQTGYNTSKKSAVKKTGKKSEKEFNDEFSVETDFESLWSVMMLVVILSVIGFYIGMYILVAVIAQKKNRNAALWVLVSLLATPLLAIIILLVLGKDETRDNCK